MKTLKDQSVLPALSQALQGEVGHYEGHYLATYSDANKWIAVTCAPSRDSSGKCVGGITIVEDITKTKSDEAEIRNLAFFDPLTCLPNRRLLQDRLQQALTACSRSGKQGALLFIDMDNFKTLNDTLGHDIGDMLLQQAAQRLKSCVREGDTVARLGGDEFVIMLEDLSEHPLEAASQTEVIGDKILAILNQPYQLGIHGHHSSASIGVTHFKKHQSTEDVMKQADIAMYQAKKAGRNTLRFFDQNMQFLINERMALEAELRQAIDKQQLLLYYQLQVDHTRHPLGAEALLRWQHPERGLISPAEFIPIAEEMGLIHPIGWWVLKAACAQIKAWQDDPQTRNLVLSVNVSAKQFHRADFTDQVKSAMQLYDVNPTRLKLELTEGMLLEDMEDTIATMYALKDLGVSFSLDDFGTGYSSLRYLKRLPFTQLKIDQSFIQDIAVDSSDKAIVRTIIAMAQSLNLDVIAEGVETDEQQEILQRIGCNHYQGYVFGKPVPIEQFDEIIKLNGATFHAPDPTAMMLRLNWHKSYECGEHTIDQEHHKLFELANILIEFTFTRNENPPGFERAMDEVLAHVVKHFADEEALLALHHYAGLEEHKAAHQALIEQALKLRQTVAEDGVTIGELVNFLASEVVAQHLLKEDRKFYTLFNKS
jgi:diguanylate cyclase (GGDEF)-like protein/hemerythrin-like metal-binding protein